MPEPRICIVCQNASMKYGGEASLPWLLFKFLRGRGVDAHLVAHGRTAPEVVAAFGADRERLHFIPETAFDRFLYRIGRCLPGKIDAQTTGVARHIYNQVLQKKIVRRLIESRGVNLVHEINPVSPKQISLMYGLGVPVVIGPLAGGMLYPPGFSFMDSRAARLVESAGRAISQVLSLLMPGKLLADVLIAANRQSSAALPRGVTGRIEYIPDVGVDLGVWQDRAGDRRARQAEESIRFVYLGRLAEWKGVRYLLDAMKIVADEYPGAALDILGGGEELENLQRHASQLQIEKSVSFVGWVSGAEGAKRLADADVLVLPSLHEVGGIVILEAMAAGLPVIATNWGGPAIHITDETGIRVDPISPKEFSRGLADAMLRLARSLEMRESMSKAGQARVHTNNYDWSQKTDRFVAIYRELLAREYE